MSTEAGGILIQSGDPDRRALIAAPDNYPLSGPLFWYVARLLTFDGWTVARTTASREGATESVAEFLTAPNSLLVTKSGASLCGVDLPGVPGIWFTPELTNLRLVEALSGEDAVGLLVGSVGDPTWNVEAAARLRRMEILQLTGVDHDLEVRGDPVATLAVLGRVVGRCQAMIRRLSRG